MMTDAERYLWSVHFTFHGDRHMWWAYFAGRQEVEACVERLRGFFPCMQVTSLEEQPHGMVIHPDYYHYCLSHQEQVRLLRQKGKGKQGEPPRWRETGERDETFFRLAPLTCDYLISFVNMLGDVSVCSKCELLAPGRVQPPLEWSRSALDGRREFRSDRSA